jgi:ribosome-binding protein aMBF1 (putative translation factor)
MDYFTPVSERIISHKVDNKKTSTELKNKQGTSAVSVNGKKIRDDDELPQVEKVGIDIGKQIMQARLAKNLKQADLAKKLNITPDFIRDYENGTAPMNKVILNNIGKALGIRILF